MAKPDTKYIKAIDVLRAEILGGKYSSAHPFPSIMGVSRRFAVSRPTAVKVFDRLKAEGLVCTRAGAGTFLTNGARSRLVGLMIPGISYSSEFFQPIVASLLKAAHAADYTVLMEGVWSPD